MGHENNYSIGRLKIPKIFDMINVLIMLVLCFSMIYPIWYVIVYSFSDGTDALMGGIYWFPRMFSLENYKEVFGNDGIIMAFEITVARTLLATTLHVFFTAMVAYALSKSYLMGRKFYMAFGTVTLFFSGGLIPYFLLIKNLHMYDNFLVYVIPAVFSFYNLIIFNAFFRQLPASLEESAKIDGANDFTIFIKVVLPLSTPVLATIALFVGVGNWNDYFTGVIFINDNKLLPIQTLLYKIVAENTANTMLLASPQGMATRRATSTSLKMAMMVITTMPITIIYPFLQKYFVKGMLLGSIKG
jgi:putative aldouronate transport system permease protein